MRRPILPSIALLFVGLALAGGASPSPPCPPTPEYDVAFQAHVWVVSIRLEGGRLPGSLDRLAAVTPWSETPVLLAEHIGRPATAAERVAVLDGDGDRRLSAGDQLQFWDSRDLEPSGRVGEVRLLFLHEGDFLDYGSLFLEDGLQVACMTATRHGDPSGLSIPGVLWVPVVVMLEVGVLLWLRFRNP